MTDEELKAIEARAASPRISSEEWIRLLQKDFPALVAEVWRLRSENGAHVAYIADVDAELLRLRALLGSVNR